MIEFISENPGAALLLFAIIVIGLIIFVNRHINSQADYNRHVHDLLSVTTKELANLARRDDYIFSSINNRLSEIEQTAYPSAALIATEPAPDLKKFEDRIKRLEDTLAGNKEVIYTPLGPSPFQHHDKQRIFMPLPDRNKGGFRKMQGKDKPASTSTYVLEIDPEQPNKAHFYLLENQQVEQLALNFSDSYLQPCIAKGIFAINKKINRIAPGIAELQGDYWVIIEKAQIEYV